MNRDRQSDQGYSLWPVYAFMIACAITGIISGFVIGVGMFAAYHAVAG